ncbi:hypothetical protein J6590_042818 [Homalodisca vitripennis]|nr:hypothetical protein J6590_042818 [Homalodisca vitripennis]
MRLESPYCKRMLCTDDRIEHGRCWGWPYRGTIATQWRCLRSIETGRERTIGLTWRRRHMTHPSLVPHPSRTIPAVIAASPRAPTLITSLTMFTSDFIIEIPPSVAYGCNQLIKTAKMT